MENEPPKKRQSLLPQRSTSIASNANIEESGKLAPPPKPKQRDVSPSKLPVGGLRRTQSIQVSASVGKQPGHKSKASTSSVQRDGLPSITPVRTAPAAQHASSRKPATLGKSAAVHAKQGSISSRPNTSHRNTASVNDSNVSTRPTSSGKDSKPASVSRATSRILANVKVQRPASAAHPKPQSPKKAPTLPVINKFALLTTPTAPALKPSQDARSELLHLHSLHKESHATKTQWTASAKLYYEKHFKRLIRLEEDLKASEMEFLEQQNAAALIDWCKEVCAGSGESKTKVLSSMVNEMWLLVSPGGRYTATVHAFESWHNMIEKELDHRLHDCHVDIMEGLGDGWKAEVDALMDAICRMSDDLESLGPVIEPSDLSRCVNVIMTMQANMLEELVLVRDIEDRLVEREGSFVKDRIEGLTARVSGEK